MSVSRKSPAHQARLRKGDHVLEIDNTRVRHATHLQDLIRRHVGGEWLLLKVRKKDKSVVEVLVQLDTAG